MFFGCCCQIGDVTFRFIEFLGTHIGSVAKFVAG
jgi:hypothetical protein